jgi:hypothetical protein
LDSAAGCHRGGVARVSGASSQNGRPPRLALAGIVTAPLRRHPAKAPDRPGLTAAERHGGCCPHAPAPRHGGWLRAVGARPTVGGQRMWPRCAERDSHLGDHINLFRRPGIGPRHPPWCLGRRLLLLVPGGSGARMRHPTSSRYRSALTALSGG